MILFPLFFLVIFSLTEVVTEDNQQQFKDREVSVRGFLYQDPEGHWILAPEPNLRSCCVGSKEKMRNQIALGSDFKGVQTRLPVIVKGVLKVDDEAPFPLMMEQPELLSR